MKKIKALSLILIVALLLALSACGSFKRVTEDKIYQENINNFFAALDDRIQMQLNRYFHQRSFKTTPISTSKFQS